MFNWGHVVGAALGGGLVSVCLITFIWKWCCNKKHKEIGTTQDKEESLRVTTPKGLQGSPYAQIELNAKSSSRGIHNLFRHGNYSKQVFNWADHPSLVTDAVEYGWSRFGFTDHNSAVSTRSPLLGICSVISEFRREEDVEISWEVSQESADFMQKVRINPGLKREHSSDLYFAASSVMRTALPLPGPYLGNISFPQEAFFEITILESYDYEDHEAAVNKAKAKAKAKEGEKDKLIQESCSSRTKGSESFHAPSYNKSEVSKKRSENGSECDAVKLSIGLTTGGHLPIKLPGSYLGSIGFNSNGSVYLDGIKLVFESRKDDWGKTDKVVGCGYNPRRKKVFFTVDSELKHEIHCKTEDFGSPLYPILAANTDIMVLVNFGQSAFKYARANANRTPNPCFVNPVGNSHTASLGYDDSKELFSMGRIDSKWFDRSAPTGNHSNDTNHSKETDDLSEADLFEISLDRSGRSPITMLKT